MGLLTERRCTSCSEFIAKSAHDCPKCGAHDPFGNLAKDDVPSTSHGSGWRDYSNKSDFPEVEEAWERMKVEARTEAEAAEKGMGLSEYIHKMKERGLHYHPGVGFKNFEYDPAAERRAEERLQAKERERYFKEVLPIAIVGTGIGVGAFFLAFYILTLEMDPVLRLWVALIPLSIAAFILKKIGPKD